MVHMGVHSVWCMHVSICIYVYVWHVSVNLYLSRVVLAWSHVWYMTASVRMIVLACAAPACLPPHLGTLRSLIAEMGTSCDMRYCSSSFTIMRPTMLCRKPGVYTGTRLCPEARMALRVVKVRQSSADSMKRDSRGVMASNPIL